MRKILVLIFLVSSCVILAAETFPVDSLSKKCIPFSKIKIGKAQTEVRECKVSEYGEIGTFDGQKFSYALYCLIPNFEESKASCGDGSVESNFHQNRGLAIFTRDVKSKQAKLFLEKAETDLGIYLYEKPEVIKIKKEQVLVIPIRVDGTGNGNASEYYIRKNKKWIPLDTNSWFKTAIKSAPPGTSVLKGVWPDLKEMKAKFGLYKKDDANCCPTGGFAVVDLELSGDKLVTKKVIIEPSSEDGE